MFWWQGIVAGLAGTIVMTVMMRIGKAAGMTGMNMPLLMGSVTAARKDTAQKRGMAIHLINGGIFGLLYAVIWWAFGLADAANAWWVGLIIGIFHGIILIFLMPAMGKMHPRATAGKDQDPERVDLPRTFGFGGRVFGKGTPAGMLMGHMVFGVIWGLTFWALIT